MGHHEGALPLTAERASVLNTALEYYCLWLESHPEQHELRKDIPLLEEMQKEVQTQVTAQSPQGKLDRFVWYGRTPRL